MQIKQDMRWFCDHGSIESLQCLVVSVQRSIGRATEF